jgi:hypothetical protein
MKAALPENLRIGASAAPQLTEDAGNAQMSLMGTAVGRDTGKADRDAYTRGKGMCEQRSKYA